MCECILCGENQPSVGGGGVEYVVVEQVVGSEKGKTREDSVVHRLQNTESRHIIVV